MGITRDTMRMLDAVPSLLNRPWREIAMLELGNQEFHGHRPRGHRTVKTYITEAGGIHVSVDTNGRDGAIPMDLSGEWPQRWAGLFDVVTNFGTLEHVGTTRDYSDQHRAWRQVHDAVRVGGLLLHIIPIMFEQPKAHAAECQYVYDDNFLRRLADANAYREELYFRDSFPCWCGIWRKTNTQPFIAMAPFVACGAYLWPDDAPSNTPVARSGSPPDCSSRAG